MSFFHIEYLKDVVDYFILIESDSTHSGTQKKSFYYLDKYKDTLDSLNKTGKIIAKKISFPRHLKFAWAREKHQRNIAKSVVLNLFHNSSFVLIVGDADEIPRRELVKNFSLRFDEFFIPSHLMMSMHYYSFKWVFRDLWGQSFAISSAGLRNLTRELSDIRVERTHMYLREVSDAGWHCSYCMNATDVAKKLRSFAHQEYNREHYQDLEWVERCRQEGRDLFNRSVSRVQLLPYKGAKGYPQCEQCKRLPGYSIFELPDN